MQSLSNLNSEAAPSPPPPVATAKGGLETAAKSPTAALQEVVRRFVAPIEIELETTQLSAMQPPYFPNHFTKWRKKALIALHSQCLREYDFSQRLACLAEFYARVNGDLRARFVAKLKRPYVAILEAKDADLNEGVGDPLSSKKIRIEMGLAESLDLMNQRIAEWCIQMELAEDTKEIACELGLLGGRTDNALGGVLGGDSTPVSNAVANGGAGGGAGTEAFSHERLEGQLLELVRGQCKERLGYKMSSFVTGYVAEQVEGFSRVVTERGWRSSNLSYETYMSLYLRIMGTGGLPISMILPQFALLYVAAGVVGAALIRRVSHWIQGTSIEARLNKVAKGYWDSAIFLQDFNLRCQDAILRCLRARDEDTLREERRHLCRDFSRLIYEPDELNEILAQEEREREIRVQKRPDGVEMWTLVEKERPVGAPAACAETAAGGKGARGGQQAPGGVRAPPSAFKHAKPFKEVPLAAFPGWVEWQ